MTSQKHLKFAYGLALACLVVGVIAYAAASTPKLAQPNRLVFTGVAGKVIFDHQVHASAAGYGVGCLDCHHHPPEEESEFQSCRVCHLTTDSEALPESCSDCHDEDEIADTKMLMHTDALHGQCIACHTQFGAGPVECASCHITVAF